MIFNVYLQGIRGLQRDEVFMNNKDVKLYDLIDLNNSKEVLDEIQYNISLMVNDFDFFSFELVV